VLLFKAMQETGYDALAKVAMHGREHIVILRPAEHAIMLHTMYFVDELHKANEVKSPTDSKFDEKEIDLAKKLIETLAGSFEPEKFHDEYKQSVEKMIEKKRSGKKITPVKQPRKAPVIDLMQALQQSLAKDLGGKSPKAHRRSAKKTPHKRSTAA
jgi:DNA end-binding protein Ku